VNRDDLRRALELLPPGTTLNLDRDVLLEALRGDAATAVVAVGATHADLVAAVNAVVAARGGIAVAEGGHVESLALPVAGLMATDEGDLVAARYAELDRRARGFGCPLRAPLMTLSFMALLVIPELKMSDRGLFDGRRFAYTPLQVAPAASGRGAPDGAEPGDKMGDRKASGMRAPFEATPPWGGGG
jgi:hypothetical protein